MWARSHVAPTHLLGSGSSLYTSELSAMLPSVSTAWHRCCMRASHGAGSSSARSGRARRTHGKRMCLVGLARLARNRRRRQETEHAYLAARPRTWLQRGEHRAPGVLHRLPQTVQRPRRRPPRLLVLGPPLLLAHRRPTLARRSLPSRRHASLLLVLLVAAPPRRQQGLHHHPPHGRPRGGADRSARGAGRGGGGGGLVLRDELLGPLQRLAEPSCARVRRARLHREAQQKQGDTRPVCAGPYAGLAALSRCRVPRGSCVAQRSANCPHGASSPVRLPHRRHAPGRAAAPAPAACSG